MLMDGELFVRGLLAASCQLLGKSVSLRRFGQFSSANPSPVDSPCPTSLGKGSPDFRSLTLTTARLSATHNNLSVASLLQIVFAAVTAVRCAPLTRSPNRLRDESVSLDFRSPSAPYKSSSLTFPLQAREGQLLRRSRWTSTLNSQISTLSLSAIMTIY